jgi:hypothetical protein
MNSWFVGQRLPKQLKIGGNKVMNSQTNPMFSLAERYADELTAQFRTLNFFVKHAGEIGGAHETYLKGVISRFLPPSFAIGTGFIAAPDWISSQQDIILYKQLDLPTLFKVGECIVVDYESVIGAIEVKTQLNDTNKFIEAYKKLVKLSKDFNSTRFTGLFIWDGLSLETTLSVIWDYIRENPTGIWNRLPNLIYVRSRYLLLLNESGDRRDPPFRVLHISEESSLSEGIITEGLALISLISEIWNVRGQLYAKRPWWLMDWWRVMPQIEQSVFWPEDIANAIWNLE